MFLIIIFATPTIAMSQSFQYDSVNGTDTKIAEGSVGTNYGTTTSLQIGETVPAGSDDIDTLMHWNHTCPSITELGSVTITEVLLWFDVKDYFGETIQVYPANTAWTETGATWTNMNGNYNSSWDIGSQLISNSTSVSVSLDTNWYNKYCDGDLGTDKHGLYIIGSTKAGAGARDTFWSSDNGGDGSTRPKLIISYDYGNRLKIDAKSIHNSVGINNFNVTVNGTKYEVTTGSVQPPITTGQIVNILVESSDFDDVLETNWNTNANYTAQMTQEPLTNMITTIEYGNLYKGKDIKINATWNNPTPYNVNHLFYIYNYNDTRYDTQTTSNITINGSWLFDSFNLSTQLCTLYRCQNTTINPIIPENTITMKIILNIKDAFGNIISAAKTVIERNNLILTGSPLNLFAHNYINSTNKSIQLAINVTDLAYEHRSNSTNLTINETNEEFNITLQSNQLLFKFYKNGNLTSTSGYLADLEKSFGFNGTSVLVVQSNLTEGRVNVRFGLIENMNHTQFYEYNNDLKTHVSEDIELITNADWSSYIKIQDQSGVPIEGAIITVEYSYHALNIWKFHKLLGQRITDNEGITWFYADTLSEILITVVKDGYSVQRRLITIGDESYTQSNPLIIELDVGDARVLRNAWSFIDPVFSNKTTNITGTITAKGRTKVEIQTDYRDTLEKNRIDISETKNNHDIFSFSLEQGEDFSTDTQSDIILTIWLDNELWRTQTIVFDASTKTRLFSFSGISSTILNPILLILLLVFSAGAGKVFQNENSGFHMFMIGGVIISFISLSFLWLSIINMFYYLFRTIHKVISQ